MTFKILLIPIWYKWPSFKVMVFAVLEFWGVEVVLYGKHPPPQGFIGLNVHREILIFPKCQIMRDKIYSWHSRQQTKSQSKTEGAFSQKICKNMHRRKCTVARLAIILKNQSSCCQGWSNNPHCKVETRARRVIWSLWFIWSLRFLWWFIPFWYQIQMDCHFFNLDLLLGLSTHLTYGWSDRCCAQGKWCLLYLEHLIMLSAGLTSHFGIK